MRQSCCVALEDEREVTVSGKDRLILCRMWNDQRIRDRYSREVFESSKMSVRELLSSQLWWGSLLDCVSVACSFVTASSTKFS